MNYELSNILFVFPYFIEISKNKILISRCEKLTDDGCQVMAKAHIAFSIVTHEIPLRVRKKTRLTQSPPKFI